MAIPANNQKIALMKYYLLNDLEKTKYFKIFNQAKGIIMRKVHIKKNRIQTSKTLKYNIFTITLFNFFLKK